MTASPATLNDVCLFIVDCLHATAPTQEEGYPLIRTPNIGKGRLKLDGVYRVSKDTYDKWTRRAVPEVGDLILAREAPAGNVAIVKEGQEVCLGQRTVHLRPDKSKVDSDFLCYYLLAPPQQGALLAGETGATAKHVNMKDIRRLPLKGIPHNTYQKKIGHILSTYDDLIENNRRRIQLLEKAARLLYKEWFVHLRFPGHEHTKIHNGIPEGWEKTIIRNVSSFIARGITPKYDGDAPGVVINQKCIRDQRLNMELARHQSKEVNPNKLLRYGDVLINSTGEGTLGRVAQFLNEMKGCTVDSHITIARPADGVPVLLYGQQIMEMENYLSTMGRGATNQTELSKDVVADLPYLCPPHVLTDEFESKIKGISKQVTNLTQQNVNLSKARDLLLPRLMNGEVAV